MPFSPSRFTRAWCVVATFAFVAPVGAGAATLPPSPAAGLDFAPTPEKIAADCTAAIADLKRRGDAIAALAKAERTYANVVVAMESAVADADDRLAADLTMSDIGPKKEQRDAARACDVRFSNFRAEQSARPDRYAVLADVAASGTAKTAIEKRILDETLADAKRSGAALSPADRTRYLALKAELAALRQRYAQNINETRVTMRFTADQLRGLSPARLASFPRDGDAYVVAATEANLGTITAECSVEATRKAVYSTYVNQVAAANDPIFEQVVPIRAQLAALLGYPNWAAYVLERRMARTPAAVDAFLADLDAKLLPQARSEAEVLRGLKVQETGNRAARLEVWDTAYYTAMLKRTKYALDPELVRSYYPIDKTVPAIFAVYSQLLGVTFAERAAPNVWAPNVRAFAVGDAQTGRYLGDIYVDLLPREGKNAHFHNSTFWPHRVSRDGTLRPALTAIVGEFPQPAPGQPALLTQSQVETFFHEFGHAIAAMVKASPPELDFRWDFVEAPSQMLENWVWEPSVLKRITSNVTTGLPMPDDLIAKLRATRAVDKSALFWTRQIAAATADMTYHEHATAPNPNQTWASVYSRTTPLVFPADIHYEANFNHIVGGGYSAGYYGYLWSKVYAQDMFARFAREGVLNGALGRSYRDSVLANAGLEDSAVSVARFTGHPLDPAAFYETLGTAASR